MKHFKSYTYITYIHTYIHKSLFRPLKWTKVNQLTNNTTHMTHTVHKYYKNLPQHSKGI
jgi:hypothetical protein